jgi:hypothetical protein
MAILPNVSAGGSIIGINNLTNVPGQVTVLSANMACAGELLITNQNNGTGGTVLEVLQVGTPTPGSGLGPFFRCGSSDVHWVLGCDLNDSSKFKIVPGYNFTVPPVLTIDTTGLVKIVGRFVQGVDIGATFNIYDGSGSSNLLALEGTMPSGGAAVAIYNSGTISGNATLLKGTITATDQLDISVQNTGRGSAIFQATSQGTVTNGYGPYFMSNIVGGQAWCFGGDPNAGGNFKIVSGFYLNQPSLLTINASSGEVHIAQGLSVSGHTILAAATATNSSINIPVGTAPTSPVDGDIWYDGTNLKMRVGGTTKTFTLT